MLASWFRLKYPHLALGALASSAPILYFDNITPQNGYFSVVTKDFRVTHRNSMLSLSYFHTKNAFKIRSDEEICYLCRKSVRLAMKQYQNLGLRLTELLLSQMVFQSLAINSTLASKNTIFQHPLVF